VLLGIKDLVHKKRFQFPAKVLAKIIHVFNARKRVKSGMR